MVTTLIESSKASSWQQSRNSAAVSSSIEHPPFGDGKRIAALNSLTSLLILRYLIGVGVGQGSFLRKQESRGSAALSLLEIRLKCVQFSEAPMTFSKLYDNPAAAVADIRDGATLLIGGATRSSEPTALLAALLASGVRDLTCVCDFADWDGSEGILQLVHAERIARIISPYPFVGDGDGVIQQQWEAGALAVEVIPQGTLAERLRAAGAGIGGVFVAAGLGTRFADGRETRTVNGVERVLESPLRADFALIRAARADTLGNLAYQGAQRGWNAVMAPAARITIAEVDTVGEPGTIDPELVITPGIYVNRVVQTLSTGERG